MKVPLLPLAGALAAFSADCLADNLLKNASFEAPSIEGRVPARQGGNPALAKTDTTWAHFQTMDKTGKIKAGMTTEVSHTGKQSIFVEFEKSTMEQGAFLMSDLIPIKAEEAYRVSLWGRLDRKKPLTLDQGRPYMQVEVDFLLLDQATPAGDPDVRTQMIPGSPKRLMFVPGKWTEYAANFKSPAGAEFMKVTFRWESPKTDEPAAGTIYFDDIVVDGQPGTAIPSQDPPEPDPEEPPGQTPAGAPPAAVPAAPRAPAAAAATKK
jgi:hypothetical protein